MFRLHWQSILAIIAAIVAAALGLSLNVASTQWPEEWKPYLGLSWPASIVLLAIGILVTLLQRSADSRSKSSDSSDQSHQTPVARISTHANLASQSAAMNAMSGGIVLNIQGAIANLTIGEQQRAALQRSMTQAAPISLNSSPLPDRPLGHWTRTSFTVHSPPREENFVGRDQLIRNLLSAEKSSHMVVILGIPGVGKTALMREIAAQHDATRVFWYDFKPGLVSLGDVLLNLAVFLDRIATPGTNLFGALQSWSLSERARIDLIIQSLNATDCYLFFDSFHHTAADPTIQSFFSMLLQDLKSGATYVVSRSIPDFFTPIAEAKGILKRIEIDGLEEPETALFFQRRGIQVSAEAKGLLQDRFNGLPLALELATTLLETRSAPFDLASIATHIENSALDYLFGEVYAHLEPTSRDMLTVGSLLVVPFTRSRLLKGYQSVFGHPANEADLLDLKRKLLVRPLGLDLYRVHDVIATLALRFANPPTAHRIALADLLAEQEADDPLSQLSAILLYVESEEFDRAAEITMTVVDSGLSDVSPGLAETLLNSFRREWVTPEHWTWLLASRGDLSYHWHRYTEAEDRFQQMLRSAEDLHDRFATAVALLRLGNTYLRQKDKRAEAHYRDSLTIYKKLRNVDGQAQVQNNLGLLYVERHRFADARTAFQKGLQLLERAEASDDQKLSLFGNLGYLYAEQEQWERAVEFTRKALHIAQAIDRPDQVALSLYNLGLHEAHQKNYPKAREYFLESLELAEKYDLWEAEELLQIALGRQSFESGDVNEAIARFQRVIEIEERVQDKAKIASIYFDIGTFYFSKQAYQDAMLYYEKGIALFEHLTDPEQQSIFLTNILAFAIQTQEPQRVLKGIKLLKRRLRQRSAEQALALVYGTLGEIYSRILDNARVGLAYKEREITILGQLGLQEEQAEALVNLVALCEELRRFGDGIRFASQAISTADTCGFTRLAAIGHFNRGNQYATLEMWREAEDDYQRSIELARMIKDDALTDSVQHNLGEMYRREGRPGDAIPLLESSLAFAREHGNTSTVIRTLNNLGLAHQALSSAESALSCFDEALQLSQSTLRKHDEANTLISLGNYYLEVNQPDRAKEYFEHALAVARETEDVDMEEGSILSLAYAHRLLGTVDEIAGEFKIIAERAGELEHYENLTDMLTFAGESNLEEGECASSAEMFDQALIVAVALSVDRIEQLESTLRDQQLLPEFTKVVVSICKAIDRAVQDDRTSHAKEMHRCLTDRLETEVWGETGIMINKYLRPISDYLSRMPAQSLGEFLARAWGSDHEPRS